MDYTFLGVRGSIPASGNHFNLYGGHTSCSLVQSPGKARIIIDTGTGIIGWGRKMIKIPQELPLRLNILFTHFHLDHLIGLPFFAPLFSPSAQITFYSSLAPENLKKCLSRLMGGKYFPAKFLETPSKKTFRKIPEKRFRIGGIQIAQCPLNHPQGAVAFRFQDKYKSIVLATDTEHPESGIDERLASFASKSDYLIYDAMFTPAEYRAGKRGWGHSTWEHGIRVAKRAEAQRLILSHFNPVHTDRKIDQILSLARKKYPKTLAAKEGQKIRL